MNKDDYKALKVALCRHDIAFDEQKQIELQEFERLQKELDNINSKCSIERKAVFPPFLSKYEGEWIADKGCKNEVSDKKKATLEDLINVTESLKEQGFMPKTRMVDFIEIPEGATNGDIIKAMFPTGTNIFDVEWWNSPYKQGGMKNDMS